MSGFRCSAASLDRAEPLYGTASTVRAFLLVEHAGAWGVDALRDCRMPSEVTSRLRRASKDAGVRILLIRRHGRRHSRAMQVFAAYTGVADRTWMGQAHLDSAQALLDVDLRSLAAGSRTGWAERTEPLFLVCTHGRHDACCAEKGRPVAAALDRVEPEATWEVSHIGGDRFAGNALVLGDGSYYGRLDAASAVAMAAEHRSGRILLDHWRGRCSSSFAEQAAEWYLRDQLELAGIDDVRPLRRRVHAAVAEVEFQGRDGAAWVVGVTRGTSPPQRLTCSALQDSPIPRFDLAFIREGSV